MGLYIGNNKYKVMIGNQKCSFVTEDKVLPYDYEVEYLERSGPVRVNTEITPKKIGYIKAVFELGTITKRNFLFGCSGNGGGFVAVDKNGNLEIENVPVANGKHTFEFSNKETLIDGTSYASVRQYMFRDMPDYPFVIFQYQKEQTSSGDDNIRLYSFTISQYGEILRDMIPVVKNNIGYMYDRISGRLFGNELDGSLIAGPRVNN